MKKTIFLTLAIASISTSMSIQAADVKSVFNEAVAMANAEGQELAKVIFKFIPADSWKKARNSYRAEFNPDDVLVDLPDSPQGEVEVGVAFTKLMTEEGQPGKVLSDKFGKQ